MRGIEELKKYDPKDISSKTFISIEEVEAILNLEYDVFNKTKAIGFIHILQREYKVDLSEWLEAFEAYEKEFRGDKKNIFVVADEKPRLSNLMIIIISVAVAIFILIAVSIFYSSHNKKSSIIQTPIKSPIVKEAKDEMQKRNLENNIPHFTPKEETEENNQTTAEKQEKIKPDSLYIQTDVRLWVSIKFFDGTRSINKILDDRFELDPTKDQEITFGHGKFILFYNGKEYKPKSSSRKVGYRFFNKKIIEFKPKVIKLKHKPKIKPTPLTEDESKEINLDKNLETSNTIEDVKMDADSNNVVDSNYLNTEEKDTTETTINDEN